MLFPINHCHVPNLAKVGLVYILALGWLAYIGWSLAVPPNPLSFPVLAAFIYVLFRFVFELTLNRNNIPTLTTSFIARWKIASVLKEEISSSARESYKIVDMGSGRGQLASCIARKIPQAQVTGIEFARFPYMQASWVQRLLGPKNLAFHRTDFWQYDCTDVDAVVMYLGPLTATRMGEKLKKEMKKGGVVISHIYPLLGEWTAYRVLTFRTPFKESIYVYRQP